MRGLELIPTIINGSASLVIGLGRFLSFLIVYTFGRAP
jgi:hypothetical protein